MLAPPQRLAYTPAEAAQALGICRASVYNMLARGQISAVKLGRSTRIPAVELERLTTPTASTATSHGRPESRKAAPAKGGNPAIRMGSRSVEIVPPSP